ncbi:MAG: ATP-binding protein [Candidatus Ozemobacteraceae bacterium]
MEITKTVHLRFPPNHVEAERANSYLAKLLENCNSVLPKGMKGFNLLHVRLALDETLLNAIEHGCSRSKDPIQIWFRLSSEVLEISIEDPGDGFTHTDIKSQTGTDVEAILARGISNTKGWGLSIIKSVCGDLFWNRRGNRITLIFHPAGSMLCP